MDNIDMVFYINLDKRIDRRSQIEYEFKNYGICKYERFSAIYKPYPLGFLGCTLSHLGVLKLAKERGYKNIMIVEDDFAFKVSRDVFEAHIKEFFDLNIDYNVLSLQYHENEPCIHINDIVSEVVNIQHTGCYLVNFNFFDTIIDTYQESAELLEKSHCVAFSLDLMWKKHQGKGSKFFRFNTGHLGVQRAGFSDIGNFVTNGSNT